MGISGKYKCVFARELKKENSPAGLIAIVVRENGSDSFYYTYTDHLGSILTVTNSSGGIVAEQSFDAWGRRRNPATWVPYASATEAGTLPVWLYRGYTGHEQLDRFGLINMNGRLYDPTLGRVLSPDNYVQDPFNTQSFNRYSYAFNNPLKYNDPDGNNPFIVGAILGGLGYFVGTAFSNGGFRNWDWGQFAGSVVLGALTGGIAQGIGGATASLGTVGSGVVTGAITGAIGGGFSSALAGGDFGRGALQGALWGGIIGGAMGAIETLTSNNSVHESSLSSDTNSGGEQFTKAEFRGYVSENFANIDEVEKTLNTKFNLASANNLPDSRYSFGSDGMIYRNGDMKGGVTVSHKPFFGKPGSRIYISPGIKGYSLSLYKNLNEVYQTIGHEMIHAYHLANLPSFNAFYSERSAYSWTLAVSKSFGAPNNVLNHFRVNAMSFGGLSFPKNYSWRLVPFIKK